MVIYHIAKSTYSTATSQTVHRQTFAHTWQQHDLLPAQHPQNEIENEKGAEDDERDKIDPRQLIAHSVLHLRETRDTGEKETERRGGLAGRALVEDQGKDKRDARKTAMWTVGNEEEKSGEVWGGFDKIDTRESEAWREKVKDGAGNVTGRKLRTAVHVERQQ